MPTIRLVPSTYSVSNTSYVTVTNPSNMYNNTDHTTNYTSLRGRAGQSWSQSTYYTFIHGFDFSSIPSGAIVTNFTVKIRAYRNSNQSTGSSYRIRLASTTSNNNAISNTTVSSDLTTTQNVYTIPTGSLTWDTIVSYGSNFSIEVPLRNTSTSNSEYPYVYVYGAEIEVTYETPYNVTATSNVNGITVEPAYQAVGSGSSAVVIINTDDIDGYKVEDNGRDVTSSLVQTQTPPIGTIAATADSLTTGFSGGSSMNFYMSQSSTGHNFNYAVGHTAESPGSTSSGNGSWTYVKENGGSTDNTGYADYSFDFSGIPVNATITSVQVKCYGAVEDRSQDTSHSDISLFSGNTQKGSTQSFTSSTNSIITLSNVGTWTRAELQSAKLRFAVGYYGGHIFGITWTVTYSVPQTTYYTYTIQNVAANHNVVLDYAGAYIPPEEDPQYTYVPLTISAINATTDPGQGTTRVVVGTSQVVTITPSDPQLTIALDNGVDITNQLEGGVPTNTYTVTTQVSGASYGFNLNASTGYYTSTNNGQSNSASVARINMDFESSCVVTIQYINYAEADYDYGMFGKLDTTVSTNGLTASSGSSSPDDSTSNYQLAMCSNSSSPQTITYNVPAGQHYIDVKYGKDDATDSNNDSLQWKILSVEATSGGGAYTYTLSNIQEAHSLIFVFGNVDYYYITTSGTNCRLFPNGQYVVLDGDSYRLNIVPDDINATVSITDNNTDTTSSLVREDGEDKYGNPAVSYTYNLSGIHAAHTISVSCTSAALLNLFMKVNGQWVRQGHVYAKADGSWSRNDSDAGRVFGNSVIYVRGV